MARLRAESEDLDIIDYVFVVDREEVLEGVVSIRDLLTAQPQQIALRAPCPSGRQRQAR